MSHHPIRGSKKKKWKILRIQEISDIFESWTFVKEVSQTIRWPFWSSFTYVPISFFRDGKRPNILAFEPLVWYCFDNATFFQNWIPDLYSFSRKVFSMLVYEFLSLPNMMNPDESRITALPDSKTVPCAGWSGLKSCVGYFRLGILRLTEPFLKSRKSTSWANVLQIMTSSLITWNYI